MRAFRSCPARLSAVKIDQREWVPRVTVATVVYDGARYLLVEELAEEGRAVLNQPAGHLEPGETLIEAAARETLEETGWEVEVEALLGASLFTNRLSGLTYYRTAFLARPVRHHADRALDREIIAPRWLGYEEIVAEPSRLRSESVLATIEQHRSGRRYPLDFLYPR
jgi:ADP-ribose pyrophosphatase YjhB (NUDIX family)